MRRFSLALGRSHTCQQASQLAQLDPDLGGVLASHSEHHLLTRRQSLEIGIRELVEDMWLNECHRRRYFRGGEHAIDHVDQSVVEITRGIAEFLIRLLEPWIKTNVERD